MSKSLVIKSFTTDGSWTCPAGVTKINITLEPINYNSWGARLALDSYSGETYSWGDNSFGQLGDGTITRKSSPVVVLGSLRFKTISRTLNTSFAIDYDGNAWGWGNAGGGVLGDGTIVNKSSPVAVVGGLKFVQIATSNINHSIGLERDGSAWCWGANNNGQLGDGTVVNKSSPVKVLGGFKFKYVEVGASCSFGITTDGTLYSWGNNNAGQLGDGTTIPKSSPVLVVGGLKFKKVSSSTASLGITTNDDLYGWGINSAGQIGDGTIINKSSPTLVLGGIKWMDVSIGSQSFGSSAGLDLSGNAYGWGKNAWGNIGDNTVVDKSSPVAVVGGLKFTSINVSIDNSTHLTSAITSTGSIYSWGSGTLGSLGDNIPTDKSSPVLVVGGLKFAEQVLQSSLNFNFDVVPGTTYPITISKYTVSFGNTFLGRFASKIKLSYLS